MSGTIGSENAEPNLTPMLDMVFQLITFFMLVINFKAASLDLALKLPVVGSAKMVETGGADLVVLNINQQGLLRVDGLERPNVEECIRKEAEHSRRLAGSRNRARQAAAELDSIVVLRADRRTPFRFVNRVVKACQDNGFRDFALKARKNDDGL